MGNSNPLLVSELSNNNYQAIFWQKIINMTGEFRMGSVSAEKAKKYEIFANKFNKLVEAAGVEPTSHLRAIRVCRVLPNVY